MPKLFENWHAHHQRNLLSYRLLIYIIMCSTLLAVLSTAVQLFWDYQNDVDQIEKELSSIEASYLESISSSLWHLDQNQMSIQLDGIVKLPDISYVSVIEVVDNKKAAVFARGARDEDLPILREFPLRYGDNLIGYLEVGASFDEIYQRLIKRFIVILGSQAVKTFLVSICILFIVQFLVVRHLNTLSRFTERLSLDNLDEPLEMNKPLLQGHKKDSIDQLAHTIDAMRGNIRSQLEEKKRSREKLEQLNSELEERVQYRTATLRHTNNRLSEALDKLTETKDKLVESEKMAALGELVAGVAHEINTPVGNSLTSASLINELSGQLDEAIQQGSIDKTLAHELSQEIAQASDMIKDNLERASNLVNSFKQIAVDQSLEMTQHFNVKENVNSAVQLLSAEIKKSGCSVSVECDDSLSAVSYPSAFLQVYNNLILNSLLHGFEGIDNGQIQISIKRDGKQLFIHYQDNGKGIPEQIKHRIFNPFVTSKRGGGSSGLGTHLIYNLVTQLLKGTVSCTSERGQGTVFEIRVPIQVQHLPDDEHDDLW